MNVKIVDVYKNWREKQWFKGSLEPNVNVVNGFYLRRIFTGLACTVVEIHSLHLLTQCDTNEK